MNSLERLMIGLFVLFTLLGGAWALGHHAGAKSVESQWNRAKLSQAEAQKAAVLEAVAKNDEAHKKDIATTRATLATYKRKLHEADDRITAERIAADRDRLRIAIPRRNCSAPAGAAASPIVADGEGDVEQVELPDSVERGLRDLAEDADREIARLLAKIAALQDWLKSHGFADAEP